MHGVKGLKSINQLAEKFEKGPLRFFIIVVGSISQIYAYFFPNHAIRMFLCERIIMSGGVTYGKRLSGQNDE